MLEITFYQSTHNNYFQVCLLLINKDEEFVCFNGLTSGTSGPIWIIIFVLDIVFIEEDLQIIFFIIKHHTMTHNSWAVGETMWE